MISRVKPSYKHESDYNEEKISRIDADGLFFKLFNKFINKNQFLIGKVILHPKNIVTGPSYKPLYKSFGHIPDEYERTRTLNRVNIFFSLSFAFKMNKLGRKNKTHC